MRKKFLIFILVIKYMNVYTLYPSYNHDKTVIILHGMNQDYCEISKMCRSIKKLQKGMKFIIPMCEPIDISWPDDEEQNSISWYNYFSRYDNHMKHDIINIKEFNEKVKNINDLIINESKIIDSEKISLIGISQGGTVSICSALTIKLKINKIICIDTIFLHSYFDYRHFIKNLSQNFIVFQSNNDTIYNPKFQDYTYNILKQYNHNVIKSNYDLSHCEDMDVIENFIISKL